MAGSFLRLGIVGLTGLLLAGELCRANSAPVVTNVNATQVPGTGMVEIRYALSDANGDTCTVWVKVSDNGGASYDVPAWSFTGDAGTGVRPGAGKQIAWNAGADRPGQAGNLKFRVYAEDGQGLGGMALIPAGEFLMGNSFDPGEGYSDELPRHAVYVDAFYMDRTEVTNQQYADALNWAKNQGDLITVTSGVVYKYNSGTTYPYCDTNPTHSWSRITWNGNTFGVVAGKENHPMVEVSWFGSVAYANWRSGMQGKPLCYDLSTWTCNFGSGYRLPTEAEWEKAARGGTAGHRFPWSDSDYIQHARANYNSSTSYSYDNSPTRGYHPTFSTGGYPYTSPVGYFAANGYGLHDMAGNVWEWCNDWYSGSYYSGSPYNNPHGPASGLFRVLRGGCWDDSAYFCRMVVRSYGSHFYSPYSRYFIIGFRLALDADGASVPGDSDGDGDVDGTDLGAFALCTSGPVIPIVGDCAGFDFDTDNDVDQDDFGIFQRCYSGEDVPADPACANEPAS